MSIAGGLEQIRRNRELVESLIDNPGRQQFAFQPILDVGTGEVVGYRSRTAGQSGSGLDTTAQLLAACEGTGLLERLDWAARVFVMGHALERGLKVPLHFTPEPLTYGTPCPPRLAATFGRARRELQLVAEVPLAGFADVATLRRALGEFRDWNWRIVSDDVADSPSAFAALSEVRPDWIRLDLDLAGRMPPSLSASVRRMLAWAADHDVIVMAHGVDSADRRAAAQELGAQVWRGRAVSPLGPLPAR